MTKKEAEVSLNGPRRRRVAGKKKERKRTRRLTPFSLINLLNDSISFLNPLRYLCSSTESIYIMK